MIVATHTGAVNYNGSIEQNISLLSLILTWITANTEVYNGTLTISTNGKVAETICPGLSFALLADIASFIDTNAYVDEVTANKTVKFNIPLGFGNAVDLSPNTSLTYQIAGVLATNTIQINAIDGASADKSIMNIKAIGTKANAEFDQPCVNSKFAFFTASELTRIKMSYASGKVIEFSQAELVSMARSANPIYKNVSGVISGGYGTLVGVDIRDVTKMAITCSAVGVAYLIEELVIA